jgi:2-haloacid dehalogenase
MPTPPPTARLAFREMAPADLEMMSSLLGDPAVMWVYPHPYSRNEVRDWIDRNQRTYRERGFGLWLLTSRESGEFVGECGLTPQEVGGANEIELAYHLRPEFQGRGLATEAATACLEFAREAGLKRIVSLIDPRNVASQRVAAKIGLAFEQDVQVPGKVLRVYATTDRQLLSDAQRAGPPPTSASRRLLTWRPRRGTTGSPADTVVCPERRRPHLPPIDFSRFEVLTFDCYGTLIDWETGLVAGLRAVLDAHGIAVSDDDLLERFGRHEAAAEAGEYLRYREVLARSLRGICEELGVTATDEELERFGGSVADWPAFPDSHDALSALARRFRLAVITNCDDDLFAASNRRLGVTLDWVITAQQVGSYKPSHRNFAFAFERIGVPRERILHVAQSLFHDHVPAKQLGMTTVWVDRRQGRPGSGATPPASVTPDLVVPDMATLARLATAGGSSE